jgi:hypothetical protein
MGSSGNFKLLYPLKRVLNNMGIDHITDVGDLGTTIVGKEGRNSS